MLHSQGVETSEHNSTGCEYRLDSTQSSIRAELAGVTCVWMVLRSLTFAGQNPDDSQSLKCLSKQHTHYISCQRAGWHVADPSRRISIISNCVFHGQPECNVKSVQEWWCVAVYCGNHNTHA